MTRRRKKFHELRAQHGAALMLMLVIMIMGTIVLCAGSLSISAIRIERNKRTSIALAQARDALIGHAISNLKRPGSLPCPDTNDDGNSDSCSTSFYIGRLPWKALGIADLRDGYGEHLWYALSPNFRNTISTINSDTIGQLSMLGTGDIAAVVFAAGSPLHNQQRSANAINCPTDGMSRPANQCASNYLESDNQNNDTIFEAAAESTSFNDHLLPVLGSLLIQRTEKILAKEVSNCLADYAVANNGRYPWSTKLDAGLNPNFYDKSNERFGRLPDLMTDTKNDSGGQMGDVWPGSSEACNSIFIPSGWWNNTNWRELLFYSVAGEYKPNNSMAPGSCTTCLMVNPPSLIKDKKVVILLAGKKLTGQNRSSKANKANAINYLEGINSTANSTGVFEQSPMSNAFNDTVIFQ